MTKARASARLFVAIDPPIDVREALAAWARAAVRALGLRTGVARAPVRLLEPELLHLTLCFLGERPLEEVAAIGQALAAAAAPVRELRVGAPLWLPPRRPRALAVEVHDGAETGPGDSLRGLHNGLLGELVQACGFEPEHRRFRAHVTLARLRGDRARGGHRVERESLPVTPALRFTPEAIVLYRSWLSPDGASYEALAARTLVPA